MSLRTPDHNRRTHSPPHLGANRLPHCFVDSSIPVEATKMPDNVYSATEYGQEKKLKFDLSPRDKANAKTTGSKRATQNRSKWARR